MCATAAMRVGAERPERAWSARVRDKAAAPMPYAGLSFGPTLTAMAAGRPRDVIRLNAALGEVGSQSPVMRSRTLLSVAWAQAEDWANRDAVATLLEAERLSAEQLAHPAIAHTVIGELMGRRHKQRLPGLAALAERVSLAAA